MLLTTQPWVADVRCAYGWGRLGALERIGTHIVLTDVLFITKANGKRA